MKKYNFIFVTFCFLLSAFSIASAIEVGGHITENTVWSPDNNPYIVIENIYVNEDVTLTVLPGTEIKVTGALLTCLDDFYDNFFLTGSSPDLAKCIKVDGRIIAEGTEQDSIIFTRTQDYFSYNWGSIYITSTADQCSFKHCLFEHAACTLISYSNISKGLNFENGNGIVRNCKFLNCAVGISTEASPQTLEIIDNDFIITNYVNPYLLNFSRGRRHILTYQGSYNGVHSVLVGGNTFEGYWSYNGIDSYKAYCVNNTFSHCYSSEGNIHFYDNDFLGCEYGIHDGDTLYIKNNRFIDSSPAIYINISNELHAEISDNYFDESRIFLGGCDQSSFFIRNYITNVEGGVALYGAMSKITDNIINNCNTALSAYAYDLFCNNIFINNSEVFSSLSDNSIIQNCILLNNEDLYKYNIYGAPIIRNCIMDFALPPECIDGGGNIIVDSLQVQSIFADIQNCNFHLTPGSIAIDAGFGAPVYYPFDLDNNKRIWDGDGNGSTVIDIGPYEYGAPSLGGIEGFTYNPTNGEPVDYVLIKINNEPGEFTFSDSLGRHEYKLPAGIYDVYAERVFYEDVIEYGIEVFDGQFTQVLIPMLETMDIEDYEISKSEFQISNLTNYPNPFNPSTEIRFQISDFTCIEEAEITIFNLKGQKVRTFSNLPINKSQNHQIVWDGTDQSGKSVASGIYFSHLRINNKEIASGKMLLLK